MAKSYPVDTLLQMAEIPVERVSAFIAELPDMLEMLRRLPMINEKIDGIGKVVPKGLTWVDDGELHRTITATAYSPDGAEIEKYSYTKHGDFQ